MTVKSLLQIILFLLIIIIVGEYIFYTFTLGQNHGTIKIDNNSKIPKKI